jgi:hypothetical protein
MATWVLFGMLVFLVFGVPLIDKLYRMRVRGKANQTPEMAWIDKSRAQPKRGSSPKRTRHVQGEKLRRSGMTRLANLCLVIQRSPAAANMLTKYSADTGQVDHQALANVHARATLTEAMRAKVLTQDQARRFAINIARLQELLRGDSVDHLQMQ